MSTPEHFESLILGSGQGGKLLAWHLARSGRRTAVVERRWIGGSCPNVACMPSKNEVWSSRVVHLVKHAAQFGALITGPVTIDMAKVRQRKRDMVKREIALHLQNYKTSGAELIMGSGRFVAAKTLEVRLNDCGTRLSLVTKFFSISVRTRPFRISWSRGGPTAHTYRSSRSRLRTISSDRFGRWLCRARDGSSLPTLRQSRDSHRGGFPAHRTRGSRHSGRFAANPRDEGIQFVLAAEPLRVSGQSGREVSYRCSHALW